MNDPFQALRALLQPAGLPQTLFPANSRYAGIGTRTLTAADGSTVVFLQRRFVPDPQSLALLHEHVVSHGERLDNISARYLGDPEQFWRLCDANAALRPDALTDQPGRRLRITLPAGVAGAPDA
ncbi:conserved hypothetical protein [Rubrivivax sp. A210]|uniref:LysM domain-containing protein n=1 Tax=Rubrivivax sp. A210 TaxID=2772301 RepID=UPI0019BCA58F|nr:LysM domain-containing protein [Rubrivivax sp. A210]CAD5367077.1 conserved hypothetical protein [Rubrivivax sp. A210]